MANVCEHEFEVRDPKYPSFSMTEYDLYAKLDLTLRKNHVSGKFEIVKISTKEKVFEGSLQEMVNKANELEGDENTKISCDNLWCRNRRSK